MANKSYSSNISKKQIFLLSIPVFFSNLAIPFVGLIDTGLMGNLGETKYLAATSVATSIMTMILWSFGFLRMGTVGVVAQLFGKSDYREIIKIVIKAIINKHPHHLLFKIQRLVPQNIKKTIIFYP